ncbi:MAG TPA: MerR family transcriptional regulator [Sphingomicrobium sp.]|jgi:DNA-binding transcriptional MerR regulator|nr:MerR family transcriptional regulator [Sphingomicrobium sp.]
MDQPLEAIDIREVVRRTGLTSRALRFYEARGLLRPLRTHSGRRLYGRGELERIQQILALKRAGLSLAQIGRLTARSGMDLGALVDAQLKIIEERRTELDDARALLLSIKSRIDRGEPVDAATFCSLIRQGDKFMESEDWKKVTDRYFTKEEREHWAERMKDAPAPDFDQEDYSRKWKALGDRVEAAIPSGPDSPEAQALYDEWQELLAPFKAVATPEMMAGATRLYERMGEWEHDVPAPFTSEAFRFMQEVARKRKSGA